jgi:hypothetical protein
MYRRQMQFAAFWIRDAGLVNLWGGVHRLQEKA